MPRKTVLLYADGDFEQLAELRRRVGIAERQALTARTEPRRLGDADTTEDDVETAKAAYDKFVDEAAERAEEWVIEHIGNEEWRKLLLAHPARKIAKPGPDGKDIEVDHPDDADWGVNTDEFGKALLLFVDQDDPDHRTVHKAGDVKLEGLVRRIKRLSAGQFETLWATAYALNTGGVSDPKFAQYSLTRESPET